MLLPIVAALLVWFLLDLASVPDAYLASFGSGDLLAVAAMLAIVLIQEIDKVEVTKRSLFLIVFYEHAFLWVSILWALYGACKVIGAMTAASASKAVTAAIGSATPAISQAAMKAAEVTASAIGTKIAQISILMLAAVIVYALIARIIVMKSQ